jgi:nucleoid DNA-binding protein
MRASVSGQQELAMRVQQALGLATKKEAAMVVEGVITALEATFLNNLESDGFTLKLSRFGKFSVRHKPGILRKIPFTGENYPDEGSTEGQVHQFGGVTPTGEG